MKSDDSKTSSFVSSNCAIFLKSSSKQTFYIRLMGPLNCYKEEHRVKDYIQLFCRKVCRVVQFAAAIS